MKKAIQQARRSAAARLARLRELIAVERLHPAVQAWTRDRAAAETWAVALSGGADSVALLCLVRAHWPERKLAVLHFNHRLRGRAADGDEAFCRRLCRELGVSIHVARWRRPAGPVSEERARRARLAFFEKVVAKTGSAALWTGHQVDDVAETMLMRLGRGSGPAGLAAPRPVQRFGARWNLRPLLHLNRDELRGALAEAGLGWREDATNEGDAFLRNRVRHQVLAAWRRADAGRDVALGAALARERCEEDDTALEQWVDEIGAVTKAGRLSLGRLQGKPRGVWRRALQRWLGVVPHGSDLSRQGFEQLLGAVERGRATRFSLGVRGFAVVRPGWLVFQPLPPGGEERP